MAKKHDIVAERQVYAKIKALEKEKLRKPVPTELTPDQVYMRLCMARDCWSKRNELAPSGIPWPDVFFKHWGITLQQFSEDEQQRQKEIHESHSKDSDPEIP
jgi:hypothetical protein